MNKEDILIKAQEYIKETFLKEGTGHDYYHIAVSYTHLDVYKRQLLTGILMMGNYIKARRLRMNLS